MLVRDLPTPVLLIEESRLLGNLARMQARADDCGVILRPHVKTHKSIDLARIQRKTGAKGITVAKPSEAESFVHGGFNDIRIAYPSIARHHLNRIAELMGRARISFCLDTVDGAKAASEFFDARGLVAEVLIEVDCGYGRCGIGWDSEEAVEFTRFVNDSPGLRLTGILTHAGHAYGGSSNKDEAVGDYIRRIGAEERDRMLVFARTLYEAGLQLPSREKFEISIGSTPTMSVFSNAERAGFKVTEIRPGNYIFNDAIQLALGVARPQECALTVLSTVVSKRRDRRSHERIILDAGRKILTSDTGFGTVGYGQPIHSPSNMEPLPHAVLHKLSEEHGWMEVRGGSTVAVRDRVRIIPNHACVAMNTQKSAFLVSGDKVVREVTIDARGQVV